ncbi:MAG: ABC transporter substrate-binding protein [Acidimicrobiales bacterium]
MTTWSRYRPSPRADDEHPVGVTGLTRHPRRTAAVLLAVSLVAVACGSGNGNSGAHNSTTTAGQTTTTGGKPSGSGGSGGSINVGVIGPMTGPAAEIGTLMTAACATGVYAVNRAGGPLGNKLKCDVIDDTGDPADAVPNVTRALATTSNLDMAVGLESNTAATTIPIVNRAHIPMFSTDGLVSFDKTTDQYFWRMTPADNQNGAAFAIWAIRQGWKRAAMIFQNNIGAQGNEPGVVAAYAKLGGDLALKLTIPGDAASYSSIVQKVINAHPQALIFSADPQTSATFFSEYKQLNNGTVPPIVTATDSLTPDYYGAVEKVLGQQFVTHDIALVGSYINPGTTAYKVYKHNLYSAPGIKSPGTVLGVGVISSIYDGIIIMSLAMQMAHSTKGPVYNADILKITSAGSGKAVVHTYPAALAALKAGHAIQYVGVGGAISFDQYHNSPGNYSAGAFTSGGSSRLLGVIKGTAVQHALS